MTRYVNLVAVFRNKLNARVLWELGEEVSDALTIRKGINVFTVNFIG